MKPTFDSAESRPSSEDVTKELLDVLAATDSLLGAVDLETLPEAVRRSRVYGRRRRSAGRRR